jgi:sugar phosphate isomerase/epimerase
LLDNSTREIPGDGVSPLVGIVRKLAEKNYRGPLSVELFYPHLQNGDPFEVASRIRRKAELILQQAGVL